MRRRSVHIFAIAAWTVIVVLAAGVGVAFLKKLKRESQSAQLFLSSGERARKLDAIGSLLVAFHQQNGRFPSSDAELQAIDGFSAMVSENLPRFATQRAYSIDFSALVDRSRLRVVVPDPGMSLEPSAVTLDEGLLASCRMNQMELFNDGSVRRVSDGNIYFNIQDWPAAN